MANHFLVSVNNKRAALALSDYLNSVGIANQYEEVSDGANLYLKNPADEQRAKNEIEHFRRYPNDPKYLAASWETGQTNEYSDPRFNTKGMLDKVWDQAGVFTKLIAIISVIVFLAMNFVFRDALFDLLRFPVLALNETREWWRFITPALMHFSWLHITFNLLAWMDFAGKIEKLHGTLRLIALFVFTATLSNLSQYFISGPHFGGLSGALFGLFGYVWVYGKLNPLSGLAVRRELVIVLMLWLAFGFTPLAAMVIGPMANAAHLSGLVVGALAGAIMGIVDKRF
ncbi:MAG TPA: rhomboid family intramembrane serine protease GlpG [Pseudomonadales bacterium]|nr:rhomboid family intramembrane serine protease GlpG [Pseudomonadales bacterium]